MSKQRKRSENPRQEAAFQLLGKYNIMNNCHCPECATKGMAIRLRSQRALFANNVDRPAGMVSSHTQNMKPDKYGQCRYCGRNRAANGEFGKSKIRKTLSTVTDGDVVRLPSCNCIFCPRCSRHIEPRRRSAQCVVCKLCTISGDTEIDQNGEVHCYSSCCKCERCISCQRLVAKSNPICAQCGFCESCCRHATCPHCGVERRSNNRKFFCANCVYCVQCGCHCASQKVQHGVYMAKARQIALAQLDIRRKRVAALVPDIIYSDRFGGERRVYKNADGITFFPASARERLCHRSRRYAAAEIEVAGINPKASSITRAQLTKTLADWMGGTVRDISLPDGGFEINCSPASGDLLTQQIHEIISKLNELDATVINYTDSDKWMLPCGAHVHVDARDHTYYDIRRFLLVYGAIEPALYALIAPYRIHSHYCVPCGKQYLRAAIDGKPTHTKPYETRTVKGSLIDAAYGRYRIPTIKDKRSCPQDTRYRAVNLHAWWLRGTLEFRHFHGTMDMYELSGWAEMLVNLVDAAYGMSDSEALRMGRAVADSGIRKEQSLHHLRQLLPEASQMFIANQLLTVARMGAYPTEIPRLGHIDDTTAVDKLLANLTGRPLKDIVDERKIICARLSPRLNMPPLEAGIRVSNSTSFSTAGISSTPTSNPQPLPDGRPSRRVRRQEMRESLHDQQSNEPMSTSNGPESLRWVIRSTNIESQADDR